MEATSNSRDSLLSRRSLSHRPSASCCALLTALLLLAVPVDLSSHHGCVDGAEKAHEELQFVWRRPQTAETRSTHSSLLSSSTQLCCLRTESVSTHDSDETIASSAQLANAQSAMQRVSSRDRT